MREFRPYGSVRGALRNERPYRDRQMNLVRTDIFPTQMGGRLAKMSGEQRHLQKIGRLCVVKS